MDQPGFDFPIAERDETGWPWQDEQPESDVEHGSTGQGPKISVITPSYNQGRFIEQTIRSVLLQRYSNLEYIIIDGGSIDDTPEIIRKYGPWLDYWVSEPDRGQSHAINKGFDIATGDILCWLNSDDFYPPQTLATVARTLSKASGNFAMVGHCLKIFSDGRSPVILEGRYQSRIRMFEFWKGYQLHQPAIFWRREVFEKIGGLDERLNLIMDFDYWVRISEHFDFVNVDRVLACTNYHEEAKTGDDYASYHADLRAFGPRYWGSVFTLDYWRLRSSLFNHDYLRPAKEVFKRAFRRLKAPRGS